jgi:hypothetical protein
MVFEVSEWICRFTVSITVVSFISMLTGCGSAAVPVDVPQSVTELASLHDTVKDFCGGNTEVDGHGALHEIGHVLENLQNLEAASGLTDAQRTEIASAAKQMSDAYASLDSAIHEGADFDYSTIESTVADSLDKIRSATSE